MDSVTSRITALYEAMGPGEKKLADCILAEKDALVGLSISELAAKSGCSEATVVRFSRRLGLSGYQELKISIAQESASPLAGSVPLKEGDSSYEIFTKRIADITRALENTRAVLSPEAMEMAGEAIRKANHILIFGLGNSASVARDAEHKFLRAGLWAEAFTDNHMQAIAASHAGKGDVALGISHSGSSVDVVDALSIAHTAGATTIALTNFSPSPIDAVSDIRLSTSAEETRYSILAMSSRISQLAILDALYTYILASDPKKAEAAVRATERALQGKKY